MRSKFPEWFVILQIIFDIVAVFAAVFASYFLKVGGFIGGKEYVTGIDSYWPFFNVIVVLQLVIFFSFGLYALVRRGWFKELSLVTYGVLVWAGMVMAVLFIQQQFYFSRLLLAAIIIIFYGLALCSRAILRIIRRIAYRYQLGVRSVVVIGSDNQAEYLIRKIHDLHGYRLLGVIPESRCTSLKDLFAEWGDQSVASQHIDEVWVASASLDLAMQEELFDYCADHHITYRYVPNIFATSAKNFDALYVGDYPLLEVSSTPLKGWGRILKRCMDVIVSILALIIFSPVFVIVAIAIKIMAPGPVFVGLKRVGNDGYQGTFTMYKFRSMIVNAELLKDQLMALNERKGGPLFKMKDDPRITSIGKILRKYRIDELPQLWNVIRGEMTLVGPRAHEPKEVAQYTQKQLRLLRAKPGMTGMAQVSGASDLSFDEEVRMESYYIQNWSLLLDIQILFRTIMVVINKKGAA